MRKLKPILLFATVFLCSQLLFAQKQIITGKVTDAKSGDPLGGVSVRIKATGKGVSTNKDGAFSLSAAPGDQLEISIIGYKAQTVPVGSQTSFSIGLEAYKPRLGHAR